MRDWKDIRINTDRLDSILNMVTENENKNPACSLISYWKDRMSPPMIDNIKKNGKLPYGFVGDGWPIEADQKWALDHDKRGLSKYFVKTNYRDVGDAIYQANTIMDYLKMNEIPWTNVIDFGSGYGRLAVPFISDMKEKVRYIGVDYSPIGLLVAPQFIQQATDGVSHYFISLPAWDLNKDMRTVQAFISIHSFQEMTRETIDYYVSYMKKTADKGAIFYSINLWPEEKYVPDSWELIFDRAFPINRDGAYNEKMWRIMG